MIKTSMPNLFCWQSVVLLRTGMKLQSVPGTCACPLLLHSSHVLMLLKSSTYCPRQMSSSSLIFSMGAISMKVNPAFVSILIIAYSLAIHLSTYIQPSHWLWAFWNWAPIMALTPSPEVSPPVIMRRSELGLILRSSHLLSEVSLPVIMRRFDLELISWSSHLLSEVSLSVIMWRFDFGLISWSSHLLLRCLYFTSWDGLILDSYHGPHTFFLRCLCLSSCDSLILDSYHGPHTFCLRRLRLLSWDGLILDSYHGPHTFSWGVSVCRHETVWSWTHIMVLT